MWFTRLSCSPRKLAPGTRATQGTSRAWSMRAIASLDQSSSREVDGGGVWGGIVGFIVPPVSPALAGGGGPARGDVLAAGIVRRREPRQRTPAERRAARPVAGHSRSRRNGCDAGSRRPCYSRATYRREVTRRGLQRPPRLSGRSGNPGKAASREEGS